MLNKKSKLSRKEYNREWAKKNLDKVKAWQNNWYYSEKGRKERLEKNKENSAKVRREDPIGRRLTALKHRAKRKGLEFNLTKEDFPLEPVCPIFGTKLNYSPYEKNRRLKASVDRWDNTKGYIKGNVFIISSEANARKSDLTLQQVQNLANYMSGVFS